jgi:hypothetical protein
MYKQLKTQSLCVKAGWDEETILASLIDISWGDDVGVASAMPTQLNFPPGPMSYSYMLKC